MTVVLPRRPEHFSESALLEATFVENPLVPGFGGLEHIDSRTTGEGTTGRPFRNHHIFKLVLDGYNHAIEVTDPIAGDPAYTIVSCPGFTEHIRGGIRRKMHSHTSYAHPHARVVSVESDGVGSIGNRYEWEDRHDHGMDGMGKSRQRIARVTGGEMPVFFHGTSMGSVITHRAVEYNQILPSDKQIDVQGAVWLTPALVPPVRTPIDMAARFPFGLARSLAKKAVIDPLEVLTLGPSALQHDMSTEDLKAYGWQAADLLRGTLPQRIASVISETPTVIVAGKKDSLMQTKMFKRIQRVYPDMLHIVLIPGRGHELGAFTARACDKMERESRHLVSDLLHKAA